MKAGPEPMAGTDIDAHALAADIKGLARQVEEMRDENRAWRSKQLEIFQQLSSNRTTLDNVSRRLSDSDRRLAALEAWKWKMTGILGAVILVCEYFLRK